MRPALHVCPVGLIMLEKTDKLIWDLQSGWNFL